MTVEESIITLCDRWWTELSHSSAETIRSAAEEWMEYLGWTPEDPVFLEGTACGYVVTNKKGQRIAFYFTMPGELETPSVVIEKGLDYCETTLLLVGEAQLEKHDYIVITDLNRCYVYDAGTDELILFSDSPQLFVSDVLESLLKEQVDLGELDETRRNPASYTARQLRTWCQRWTVTLSREPYGNEAIADAIMDRMLVLRFLYDHSLCETSNWSYKQQFTHVIGASYEEIPSVAKQKLLRLMNDMHQVWKCDFFNEEESITRIIAKSQNVVAMIQELALMAKTKFSMATILESFNYGDAAEKARVRLVPEASEEREQWLGRFGIAQVEKSRLEVDALEEGYRAIPYWFDRLMQSLQRVALENELASWRELCSLESPTFGDSTEMDLFAWSDDSASEPKPDGGPQVDLIRLALQKCFYIWTATDRQRRTARIVLFMHLVETYELDRFPFGVFPQLESAFGLRPAMLEADKQWICQGRSDSEEGWDVI